MADDVTLPLREERERERMESESDEERENGTWYEAVGHREDTRCLV